MDKYYKDQLQLLREGTKAFAKQYPALAPMLMRQGGDPDVERILEGTAYLCARIHERLDQNAPELVQSLLQTVFPQALLPLPSTTLIHFTPLDDIRENLPVPAGSQLASNPVDGVTCLYSTTRDLNMTPIRISNVTTERIPGSPWINVTLRLEATAPLLSLLKEPLTLHMAGTYSVAVQRFYALLRQLDHMTVKTGPNVHTLPAKNIRHKMFPLEDARLGSSRRRNRSYIELLRYFYLPEQLLFLQVEGIEKLPIPPDETSLELTFCLQGVFEKIPAFTTESFMLNVVPAINLFKSTAEPVVVNHTREEYLVLPQERLAQKIEILNVEKVTALLQGGKMENCKAYDAVSGNDDKSTLYSLRFRPSTTSELTDYLITPLYRNDKTLPDNALERKTLSIELLCCNLSFPEHLQVGDICRPTDTSPVKTRFSNIVAPTPPLPRLQDEALQWCFLSHLCTNLLSLATAPTLRAMLAQYIMPTAAAPELTTANTRRCEAIRNVTSTEEDMLYRGRLLRGRVLHLTIDSSAFLGEGDLYLFANTLDRLFAGYATVNSYFRLVLNVAGTGTILTWPPRLGEKQLL